VGEWSASRPGRSLPGKDPVLIVQKAGWAPGPVWTGEENLAPPGFDPRTVQAVASRYTDYATRPTLVGMEENLNLITFKDTHTHSLGREIGQIAETCA